MNSRFASIIDPLVMTSLLCALACSGGSSAWANGTTEPGDSAAALSLAVTEKKLAALALEAMKDSAASAAGQALSDQQSVAKKPVEKKKHALKSKRLAKSIGRKAKGKISDAPKKALNIVDRRLTPGEVRGILTTTRDFSGSDLSGMNLVGVDFSGVKFNRANLHQTNLERADLAEADLELADLTGANLRGASLIQVHLRGTRMEGSHLDGALWVDRTVCKKGSVGGCIE